MNKCAVCRQNLNTGIVLTDAGINSEFIPTNGLCLTHENLHKRGYVALICIDPKKSTGKKGFYKLKNVYRTGKLALFKRDAAKKLFNIPPNQLDGPYVFVQDAIFDLLHKLVPPPNKGRYDA